MAHTKPQQLLDLKPEFAALRALPGIIEKKPGIFYYKSTSFLHFHDKDGVRWADSKVGGEWLRLKIDFGASAAEKKSFLKAAIEAHLKISKGKK